jgi:hypothetical protein
MGRGGNLIGGGGWGCSGSGLRVQGLYNLLTIKGAERVCVKVCAVTQVLQTPERCGRVSAPTGGWGATAKGDG